MAEFKISRLRFRWRGIWNANTEYFLDDIVFYGGGSWTCVRRHTSTNFYDGQTFLADSADTSPTPAFERMTDGFSFLGDWVSYQDYTAGSIVNAGGSLYVCLTDHAGTQYFSQSEANWALFATGIKFKGDWSPNTRYQKGDVILYNSNQYRCILEHTSPSIAQGIITGNNDGNDDSTGETWSLFLENFTYAGVHTPITRYRVNDLVKYGGSIWRCTTEHTSILVQDSIDSDKFTLYLYGNNFRGDHNIANYYGVGDVVRHSSFLYVATTNIQPIDHSRPGVSSQFPEGNPAWAVQLQGYNFVGNFSTSGVYKKGDVVLRGANLFVSLTDTNQDGSTIDYLDTSNWTSLVPSSKFKGSWDYPVSYDLNDLVVYLGTTYKANIAHTSQINSFPGDNGSGFFYWDIFAGGDPYAGLKKPGDLLTYNLSRDDLGNDGSTIIGDLSSYGPARVKIGSEDQLLIIENNDGDIGYKTWGNVNRVFHVRTNGVDDDTDPNRGINYFKPFRTIRYACEKADDGWAGTTTIKVSTGDYYEILPIIIPARTAVVGEELRSARIIANDPIEALANDYPYTIACLNRLEFIMSDILTGTVIIKSTGNTVSQNITNNTALPVDITKILNLITDVKNYITYRIGNQGSNVAVYGTNTASSSTTALSAAAALNANKDFLVAEINAFMVSSYPSYVFDQDRCGRDTKRYIEAFIYDITYPGNYKSVLAARYYANAVEGSYAEDMFYVRDATGIRNMTMLGLNGTLQSNIGLEPYRRPNGGSYVSLDPGWGPNDNRTWILTRSCYVQNCTTFGYAATGQKIDGSLHNGGNKSIVSNDFTQVISDGVGCHVLNGGRAELVSVFTYYSQIGMFAEDGGIIRATNGNSSYGTFGAIADGGDPLEIPQIGKVNTQTDQAVIGSAFAGEVNDYVFILEFLNAGQDYTTANYTFTSSGTGATVLQEEFRDNGVFEAQVLTSGAGHLLRGNNAQIGTTTTITLASNDPSTEAEILGCRITIVSGEGTGQYGYITSYDPINKLATVSKESSSTPGWDHVVPGTIIKTTLTTSSRYRIEPRLTFSDPGFTVASTLSQSTTIKANAIYGETIETYTNKLTDVGLATFNVTKTGRSYSVALTYGGLDYTEGNILTITGANIGGEAIEHDITITVTSVDNGAIIGFTYEGIGTSGRFVMTPGASSIVSHSLDGLVWYDSLLPTSGYWRALAYGMNKFVTILYGSSTMAYSSDGITWTTGSMPSSRNWVSVAYGSNIFCAIASNLDSAATSINGIGWVATTLPDVGDSSTNEWVAITYGKGKFVAIANSSNAVAVGTWNGTTMTWQGAVVEVQDSSLQNWASIAYGNGRFVAISTTGYVTYSFDGVNWETTTNGMPQDDTNEMYWERVRYGQGVFFATCKSPQQDVTAFCATSYDGIVWTSRTLNSAQNWGPVAFGNPDISLGDSTKSNNRGVWVVGTTTASRSINRILTGARALGRVFVEQGVNKVLIWEPGSGYAIPPTITLTDPNITSQATYRIRIADQVLAQPTFITRGTGYRTSSTSVTVAGDGFADILPVGSYLTVDGLTTVPGPGAQFYIGGKSTYYTAVVTGINVSQVNGKFRSTFRVTPTIGVNDYIQDDMEVIVKELYSQVRITGHDFLDVGTGNYIETNYPGLYINYDYDKVPSNEVGQLNGGRVFYVSTDQDGNFRAGDLFAVEQATGIVTISADFFDLAGLTELALGGVVVGGTGTVIREFSTDPKFTANSNNIVPTQKAIISYLQSRLNIGGEDLLTASFIAGTVKVGPGEISNTANLINNIPVIANFSGPGSAIQGSILAQSMFYASFNVG